MIVTIKSSKTIKMNLNLAMILHYNRELLTPPLIELETEILVPEPGVLDKGVPDKGVPDNTGVPVADYEADNDNSDTESLSPLQEPNYNNDSDNNYNSVLSADV